VRWSCVRGANEPDVKSGGLAPAPTPTSPRRSAAAGRWRAPPRPA